MGEGVPGVRVVVKNQGCVADCDLLEVTALVDNDGYDQQSM